MVKAVEIAGAMTRLRDAHRACTEAEYPYWNLQQSEAELENAFRDFCALMAKQIEAERGPPA